MIEIKLKSALFRKNILCNGHSVKGKFRNPFKFYFSCKFETLFVNVQIECFQEVAFSSRIFVPIRCLLIKFAYIPHEEDNDDVIEGRCSKGGLECILADLKRR